jgi:Uma2 family endonuclease
MVTALSQDTPKLSGTGASHEFVEKFAPRWLVRAVLCGSSPPVALPGKGFLSMIQPMTAHAHKMTVEEWYALDEEVRCELVDGFLVEEEVTGYAHELIVSRLIRQIGNWADDHGAIVAGSNASFAIRTDRGRKPDVDVYLAGSKRPPANGVVRVPPSIMVEVVTPTPRDQRRDRVEKVADYAEFGVRWYWLVDPELRSFEILELTGGRYAHAIGVTEGRVEPPGCEGLVIDVDALWREVDALGETSE